MHFFPPVPLLFYSSSGNTDKRQRADFRHKTTVFQPLSVIFRKKRYYTSLLQLSVYLIQGCLSPFHKTALKYKVKKGGSGHEKNKPTP